MKRISSIPFALVCALAAPTFGQTNPPAPAATPAASPAPAATAPAATTQAAATTSGNPEEIIQLSPFNVQADQEHGYTSSESVTGTRIASKIIDLPFSVDVVTNSFMNDFAAYDLNSQLAFVSGVSPSEQFGQVQLRGFTIPVVMVDGFRRVGLVDTVDIDRIEVIKGPDASIYGAIQPGGEVNYVTLQPTDTPYEELKISAGGDQFYRAALSSSGPLGNSKLFYRIDLSDMSTNYSEEFANRRQSSVNLKVLYKASDDTSLEVSLEHDELYEHPFEQALTVTEKTLMPWAGNNVTESQYFGMALGPQGLYDYNYAGPESYDHNRVSSATLTFEHKFSDFWSLKFGANDFKNPYNDQLVGSGAYYPYGTGNITLNSSGQITNAFTPEVKDQPQADWKPQWGTGYQLDNLFNFNTGPVSHKLLLTTDYYGVSQRILTLVPTVNGSQATDYYALYSPYSPSGASYYTPASTWNAATLGYGWNTTLYSQDPALYNGVTQDQWTFAGDYGFFGSEHASMFNDRLNLIVGARYDWVHNEVANYNIAGPTSAVAASTTEEPGSAPGGTYQQFDYNTDAWTYQLGASYRVLQDLSLFANRSSAFNPQPQIDTYTGEPLPNNKSTGYDWGLKTSFLEGKLAMTLDRFAIYEYNLVQSETDPVTGQKDSILSGLQVAKGEELDFNYQVTSGFQLFGDWGYTQTQVLNSDTLTFYNYLPARRVPRDNVGLGFRYQFTHGALKGLYVLGGMNYYSKSLVNLGSGKSLDPGPASSTSGGTLSMYYVASTNLTYIGSDPKITGESKLSNAATPFYNLPFPGSGMLPYPNVPAGTYMNYPVTTNGTALPVATGVKVPSGDTVYVGEPSGVFVDDGRENNYNAPYALFNVGTGYQWNWGRFTNELQVNIKNLLNREYTYGSGAPGIPFTVIASYTLQF